MGIVAPCRNCLDRELGCHDRCQRFSEFKHDYEEHKNMIIKSKETDNMHVSYIVNQREKWRRNRH